MLFAVLFTDRPGLGALRDQHLQSHIDWVARHSATILVAGSLRDAPGETPRGGLWIVEAESKAAVVALIESDPFHLVGLRQTVEVFHWSKALPQRQVLV